MSERPEDAQPLLPPDNASARAEAIDLNAPAIPKSPRLPAELEQPTERAPSGDPLLSAVTKLSALVGNLAVKLSSLDNKVESLLADSGAQTRGMLVARDAALDAKNSVMRLEERITALDIATGAVVGELSERVDTYREEQNKRFDALDRKLFGTAHSATSAHDAVGTLNSKLEDYRKQVERIADLTYKLVPSEQDADPVVEVVR